MSRVGLVVVGSLTRASRLSNAWRLLPMATPRLPPAQKPDVLRDGLSVKED
ncbi:hypothetical protein SAMN04488504_106289 [Myxococcus virescens]|uniref:Uncharacterized protein n=1 Tax=Myxococcus virescens TaxID=83456 RepID=A0ABY0MSA9_9BACT|nr:hypothetical protein SAMN04488504_106289 [Myxococcus virescens]